MDKKLKRQIDLQVSELHVREAGEGEKSRTVEGYAMLFGVRSVNLTPWSSTREVYEIMEPGCLTTDLLNRSDVVLTAFHNNQMILGRWRQGKGTLSLEIDQRGLKIRCTLAETATADELLSAIERGDISGMSFAFTADEEDNENGVSYEKTAEILPRQTIIFGFIRRTCSRKKSMQASSSSGLGSRFLGGRHFKILAIYTSAREISTANKNLSRS